MSFHVTGIILTAAHKVQDKKIENLRVRCGVWDIKVMYHPIMTVI